MGPNSEFGHCERHDSHGPGHGLAAGQPKAPTSDQIAQRQRVKSWTELCLGKVDERIDDLRIDLVARLPTHYWVLTGGEDGAVIGDVGRKKEAPVDGPSSAGVVGDRLKAGQAMFWVVTESGERTGVGVETVEGPHH